MFGLFFDLKKIVENLLIEKTFRPFFSDQFFDQKIENLGKNAWGSAAFAK